MPGSCLPKCSKVNHIESFYAMLECVPLPITCWRHDCSTVFLSQWCLYHQWYLKWHLLVLVQYPDLCPLAGRRATQCDSGKRLGFMGRDRMCAFHRLQKAFPLCPKSPTSVCLSHLALPGDYVSYILQRNCGIVGSKCRQMLLYLDSIP